MNNVVLGDLGVKVSRLSFGTVFMGPQADQLSPSAGADLLIHAFNQGISYWDTSDDYGTHVHVAHALRRVSRQDVVISSKTTLSTTPIDNILQELGVEYLDILFLHSVVWDELDRIKESLKSLQQEKHSGRVRAVGISTHTAKVVDTMRAWPEVDVFMVPINATGYCLPDLTIEGGIEQMMNATEKAWKNGKGIVAMKVMGCGKFANDPRAAIGFVDRLPYVHSLCIGMRSRVEIVQNINLLKQHE